MEIRVRLDILQPSADIVDVFVVASSFMMRSMASGCGLGVCVFWLQEVATSWWENMEALIPKIWQNLVGTKSCVK